MKTLTRRAVLAGVVAGMGLFGFACQRGTGGSGEEMNRGDTTGYGAPADQTQQPAPGTGGSYQEGDVGIHDDQGMGQDPQMQQDPAMNDPAMQDPAMQDPAMQDDGMGGAGLEGEQNPGGVNSRDLETQEPGTGGAGFPAEENPENTDMMIDDPNAAPNQDPAMNDDLNRNMDAQ